MTSGQKIPRSTNTSRKRPAADDETPPPKRHHPDAVEQLLETIKYQIEKATDIWARLNDGEDKFGDANPIFLGLIKSAISSGNLAVKLVEGKDESHETDPFENE